MKVGLLTSRRVTSSEGTLATLDRYFLSTGICSEIVSLSQIGPHISWLNGCDAVIVNLLHCEHLWLAQYLEEMGVMVVNSYRALSLSSNKLITDEIMRQCGLRTPRTVFDLKERIVDSQSCPFPALVKPLYGRSRGIRYVESPEDLKNLRRKWVYMQEYVPNHGGVSRVYKIGSVVRSFFHSHEGKAWEISIADELMKRVLLCFSKMGIEIGGMDFIEGEDGYYALEVNDLPAGVRRMENWFQIVTAQVLETLERNQSKRESYDFEKGTELLQRMS